MRNLATMIFVLIIFTVCLQSSRGESFTVNDSDYATIKNKKVFLNSADTEEKKLNGLMYIDNLPENHGMVFLFEKLDYRTFWMKNMKIPLDILFIKNDKIVKIYKEVPVCRYEPCEFYKSKYKIDSVIELKSGFCAKYNIKTGDKIKFSKSIQIKKNNLK